MKDKIARWATNFFDDASLSIRPRIQSYTNFVWEIDNLFIAQSKLEILKNKYNDILDTRNALSESMTFDENFVSKAVVYLEAIESFLKEYFAYNGNKSEIVSKRILRQIVQFDCNFVDEAKEELEVDFSNPIVLESLLIAYYQSKDLKEEIDRIHNSILSRLYQELYKNKFDRLFRDIILLVDNEFYRIVDVNTINDENDDNLIAKSFKAKRENDLSSIESISVARLYEKIILNLKVKEEEKKRRYKILLIGDLWEDKDIPNMSVLAEMLESSQYKFDISRCDKNGIYEYKKTEEGWIEQRSIDKLDTSSSLLTPKGIENCINAYDKVFIMDCPEIYRDIELVEKNDKFEILEKADKFIKSNKSYEIDWDKFKNKNSFASIYYRTQNYLLDNSKKNSSKCRYINEPLLDFIKTEVEKKENDEKEVYVYVSNNKDFRTEMYDKYNFARLERYNSKDCKIIKFSKPEELPAIITNESSIIITLYKLLKMLSPSMEFHEFFAALNDEESAEKENKYIRIVEIARKVDIIINYAPIKMPKEMNMDIVINIPNNIETKENVKKIVECLVYEMFNFEKADDLKESRAKIIKYCYKKAVANVFSGCVSNFNDCLFYHLYLKKIMGHYVFDKPFNFDFKINDIKFTDDDASSDKPHYNYSFKRLAYDLMEILDADYYREDKLYEHMFQARLNNNGDLKNGLDYYVDGILNACANLNYTSSLLMYRLMKYYK